MKTVLIVLCLFLTISSTASSCPLDIKTGGSSFHHLPVGGRKALHGMVLFGGGPYFLEHIPMLTPPHDFQIITEVAIKNKRGENIQVDFSQQGFTLKPSDQFSLNDFVAGRLKNFTGEIYTGSFEGKGQQIPGFEDVVVEVKSYKLIRQLPAPSSEKSVKLTDGKNEFESLIITPTQTQQKILNLKSGVSLWCVKAPDFYESCDN